jgi:GTPase SAR1 family protein
MDSQDTNELLLNTPKEVKSSTKTNIAEQLVASKESPFYTDALNESNINNIITNEKPELIVLFGLNDLGKTTFVGSLYHLLRVNGEMGGYNFINSDTFAGFERRIFLRKCSIDGRSNTNRTLRAENPFLTLHMVHKTTLGKRLIVLSDRAGERYRDYISKDEELLKDKTIKYADRILLFVNAEELIGRSYSNMKDELRTLLRRLKEKDMLPMLSAKYIIFNKYDKVLDGESKQFKEHKQELVDLFEEMFEEKGISQHCINSKNLSDNAELEELFSILIQPLNKNKVDSALDWVKIAIKNNKA